MFAIYAFLRACPWLMAAETHKQNPSKYRQGSEFEKHVNTQIPYIEIRSPPCATNTITLTSYQCQS